VLVEPKLTGTCPESKGKNVLETATDGIELYSDGKQRHFSLFFSLILAKSL
jgi:hypothetical protein